MKSVISDYHRRLPPEIGTPATQALWTVGVTALGDLRRWARADIAALNGVGPTALRILGDAMHDAGWTFADEDTVT